LGAATARTAERRRTSERRRRPADGDEMGDRTTRTTARRRATDVVPRTSDGRRRSGRRDGDGDDLVPANSRRSRLDRLVAHPLLLNIVSTTTSYAAVLHGVTKRRDLLLGEDVRIMKWRV